MLACQGGCSSPANEKPAAPANVPPPAAGASFTLLIDGEPQPVQAVTLVKVSARGGFTMGFEAGQVGVQVFGGPKAPLVVGKYTILDTASDVLITGNLPTKISQANPEELDGFSAPFIASAPAGTPLGNTFIYNWGEGLQELRGRRLGELVFTRVGDSTADGILQSRVYRLITHAPPSVEYQGQTRAFSKLEEHTVKSTFKNLPFEDYEKSMKDLQKALKKLQ